MNEGPKEVESSKELKRWLVVVIILTCMFWIKVWADLAFGYVMWEGYLTACYAIFPVYLWVMMARRYNKIGQRVANLSALVLSVIVCILLAEHILSHFL
jgi:hypothetical protein